MRKPLLLQNFISEKILYKQRIMHNQALCIIKHKHWVKSVQIGSYFWSLFSCIRTEYAEILVSLCIKSECGKIRTRKNCVFRHFSRSARVAYTLTCLKSKCIMSFAKKSKRTQKSMSLKIFFKKI